MIKKRNRPDSLAAAHGSASPTPLEFEVCRQVLRWLRDNSGLDHSWHEPLTEIAGVVRGCKVIAEQQKEESSREAWLESLAETCQADDKPCEGCQQGGVCDGSPNEKLTP